MKSAVVGIVLKKKTVDKPQNAKPFMQLYKKLWSMLTFYNLPFSMICTQLVRSVVRYCFIQYFVKIRFVLFQ